ncbi:MAG: EI24 domain-containing protein [Fimbriimonas sp.]
MQYILEATRLIGKNPRLWRYILLPLFYSTLVFIAVVLAGYFVIVPPLTRLLTGWGLRGDASSLIGTVAYAGVWFFVAGIVFIAIASFLSSLLWDRLSVEIEELVTGTAVQRTPPTPVVLMDSFKRMILTLIMAVVALCANVVPFVGPALVAGFVGTLDYTANAYIRRNVLLGQQRGLVFRLPGWFGFYVVAGIVTLLPVVNLLMLPVMVAAGTIMVARAEVRALP